MCLIKVQKLKLIEAIGFLFLLLFVCNAPCAWSQPLFEVQRAAFCKGVKEHEPVDIYEGSAEIQRGEKVFLWMEIKVDRRALRMLAAKGEMPIYHGWAFRGRITELIKIGITKENWQEKQEALKSEVRKKGFFLWRTGSSRKGLKEGLWSVSILDANRHAVREESSGLDAYRPQIEVKFTNH